MQRRMSRLLLKNRNGFSTCQIRSAAPADMVPIPNELISHAAATSAFRRMPPSPDSAERV